MSHKRTSAAIAVGRAEIQRLIDPQDRPHLAEVYASAPDLWQKLNTEAAAYAAHRLREIHRLTGGVSAGVASLVRMEAEAFTDATYLRAQALAIPCPPPELFLAAHKLNAIAARHAALAWTLANAEHGRRRHGNMSAGPGPVTRKTLAAALEANAPDAELEPESPAGEHSP